MKPRLHELKTTSPYFQAILDGLKTFDVRYNDRDFQIGDYLLLVETNDKGRLLGRQLTVRVKYMLFGGMFGVERDYVVMSICHCGTILPCDNIYIFAFCHNVVYI